MKLLLILLTALILNAQVPQPPGPPGPPGSTGATGATGATGPSGSGNFTLANASSTGTTVNTLTCMEDNPVTGASSTAVICTAGATGGAIGITVSGAGTTGSATISPIGANSCVFDGATTANHYVQLSASVNGNCTDVGATYPTSGQVDGRVLSTNGSGGTYTIELFSPEIKPGATTNQSIRSFGAGFDGGGTALTSGSTATSYFTVPFACTITAWNITVDTGTITFDIWKIATGTAIPTVANTITASALPAISTGTALHSTTLTGWTTSVSANDIFGVNINTVATATKASLVVQCNAN